MNDETDVGEGGTKPDSFLHFKFSQVEAMISESQETQISNAWIFTTFSV